MTLERVDGEFKFPQKKWLGKLWNKFRRSKFVPVIIKEEKLDGRPLVHGDNFFPHPVVEKEEVDDNKPFSLRYLPMKEKGWEYCSGMISCRQQPGAASRARFRFMYKGDKGDIHKRLKEPHWHKTYESEEGKTIKTIIDWDILYDTINGTRGGGLISDAEIAEKDYCFYKHLCMKCKRQIGPEEDFYSPLCSQVQVWCTECGKWYIKQVGSEAYFKKLSDDFKNIMRERREKQVKGVK